MIAIAYTPLLRPTEFFSYGLANEEGAFVSALQILQLFYGYNSGPEQ